MGEKRTWSTSRADSEARLLDQASEPPSPFFETLEQYSPADSYFRGHKRTKISDTSNTSWIAKLHAETKCKDEKTSQVVDVSGLPNLLEGLDRGKYGSVSKDIEDLVARKMQLLNPLLARYPSLKLSGLDTVGFLKGRPREACKSLNQQPIHSALCDIIDLEDDSAKKDVHVCEDSKPFCEYGGERTIHVPGSSSSIDHEQTNLLKYLHSHSDLPIVILDSDEEDGDNIKTRHASSLKFVTSNFQIPLGSQKNGLGDLKNGVAMTADTRSMLHDVQYQQGNSELVNAEIYQSDAVEANRSLSYQYPKVEAVEEKPIRDLCVREYAEENIPKGEEERSGGEQFSRKEEGPHICVQGDSTTEKGEQVPRKEQGAYDGVRVDATTENDKQVSGKEQGVHNGVQGDTRIENGEQVSRKEKGVYIGVQGETILEKSNFQSNEDGLGDVWREMTLALECSKDAAPERSAFENIEVGEGEECNHSFILKDDLGYVCRVCGIIERRIETIFDFQWIKGTKTTRSYFYESQNSQGRQQTEVSPLSGIEVSQEDLTVAELSVHPRHRQQMKPHQIEGFNFLQRNLITDKPGGCILAHAPGSGKTFMIISFIQSFLARYPKARPLVVLPKGILATWRKEFQRWQVENIPLYDFYSSKAENRHQQLEVLKTWVDQNGILFLGYKQFANIVCGSTTSKTAAACHDILLKVPTILILDEGHTPRNEDTDVLHSLAKVQTPRKVVLSGTLFQNHVKEVFNILNLVRPKFLKLESSRLIIKRVLSKVHISGGKKLFKNGTESTFFDLVEATLQNDDDFKRKVTVIQDLREMTNNVLHYYKGDFLEELPGLVNFTVLLNLTSKQKNAVEKLKNYEKFKRCSVGSAVYMHPRLKELSETATAVERGGNLSDERIDDLVVKMDVKEGVKTMFFLQLLGLCESAGEKLLVFSHYLLPLKFLERLIVTTKGWSLGKEIFVIFGDSTPEQREWAMDRFNNSPDAKVFFGSIKACGEGISLVGASRVLILDVHLNPSVTRQAIGRAFRPGQVRKVYTYRLVAADSPEEQDHLTSFRKELIAKMWFEWSECCGHREFEMESVDVRECGDLFLESPLLGRDVKALYKS